MMLDTDDSLSIKKGRQWARRILCQRRHINNTLDKCTEEDRYRTIGIDPEDAL